MKSLLLLYLFVGGSITISPWLLAQDLPPASSSTPTVEPTKDSALGKLRQAFEAKLAEVRQPLTDLQKRYEAELTELEAQEKAAGNLDAVLQVQAERDTFRSADSKEPPSSAPSQLLRMRETYHVRFTSLQRQVDPREERLYEIYTDQLEKLQAELTRQSKLDEAMLVKYELDQVDRLRKGDDPMADIYAPRVGETMIWDLRTKRHYTTVGNVTVTSERGQLKLFSPGAKNYIRAMVDVSPPFRLAMRAGTDSHNVRVMWGENVMIVFNWEKNLTELLTLHPITSQHTRHPGKGFIKDGVLHDIEILVTDTELTIRVDGEERGVSPMDLKGLNMPIGIGPYGGSTVTLETARIFVPQGQ